MSIAAEQTSEKSHSSSVKKKKDLKEKKVGVLRASSNLANGILGSGIISLPISITKTGFGLGLIFLVLVTLMGVYISVKLIEYSKKVEANSFEELSQKAWGRPLFYITCVFCFLFSFGAMISYIELILSGNTSLLSNVMKADDARLNWLPKVMTICIILVIITPLSMFKDLAQLSFTSILSVFTFGVILIIITYSGIKLNMPNRSYEFINKDKVFSSIGGLSFAFVCTDSIMPVHNSLKNNSQKNWNRVTYISLAFLGTLYAVFSIICISLFAQLRQAQTVLLIEEIKNNTEIIVCSVLLNVTIILTYPIVLVVSRTYVFSIIEMAYKSLDNLSVFKYYVVHTLITCLTIVVTTLLGFYIGDFSIIFEVTGLVAGTVVGFCIPVIIFFRIDTFGKKWLDFKAGFAQPMPFKERVSNIGNFVLPIFIFLFGLIGFGLGTPVIIKDYVNK